MFHFLHCSQGRHVEKLTNTNINHSRSLECPCRALLIWDSLGFPGCAVVKESACQCRRHKRHKFNPWVGKIPWRRERQPTPVFLPGESHGQRSLAGYIQTMESKSDMTWETEHTHIGSKGLHLAISAQPKLWFKTEQYRSNVTQTKKWQSHISVKTHTANQKASKYLTWKMNV